MVEASQSAPSSDREAVLRDLIATFEQRSSSSTADLFQVAKNDLSSTKKLFYGGGSVIVFIMSTVGGWVMDAVEKQQKLVDVIELQSKQIDELVTRSKLDTARQDQIARRSVANEVLIVDGLEWIAGKIDAKTKVGTRSHRGACRQPDVELMTLVPAWGSCFGWIRSPNRRRRGAPCTNERISACQVTLALRRFTPLVTSRIEWLMEALSRRAIALAGTPKPGPEDMLAKVDKSKTEEPVDIVRSDSATTIIVPADMPLPKAVEWLNRRIKDEESTIAVHHEFNALPLEGAVAVARACQELFSWQSLAPTPGFWGSSPPALITLHISETEQVKVPWGRMVFPDIDGYLETRMTLQDGRPVFVCTGEIKRKNEPVVNKLLKRAEGIVLEYSLYRGKALKVPFPVFDDPRNFNPDDFSPRFMDLTDVDPNELVLPKIVADQVEASLFTPMKHTQACRDARVPIKRGVLLFGPYGTGKTLTMKIAAKIAVENNWTFICIDDPKKLASAIRFARRFQPALIFAEDIDRAISGENRTEEIDEILNTIDGIDSKTAEIMVCLTTNHVEVLNKAMMRPGRLDAVIEVARPDADAVAQLYRNYCGDLLARDENLDEPAAILDGQTAAVVREVCERSKMGAISRTGKADSLSASDLVISANGMRAQLELMETTPVYVPSDLEKAAAVIASGLAGKTIAPDGRPKPDKQPGLPNGRATSPPTVRA